MREAGESEWGVGEVEEDGKGAGLGVSVSFSERTLLPADNKKAHQRPTIETTFFEE